MSIWINLKPREDSWKNQSELHRQTGVERVMGAESGIGEGEGDTSVLADVAVAPARDAHVEVLVGRVPVDNVVGTVDRRVAGHPTDRALHESGHTAQQRVVAAPAPLALHRHVRPADPVTRCCRHSHSLLHSAFYFLLSTSSIHTYFSFLIFSLASHILLLYFRTFLLADKKSTFSTFSQPSSNLISSYIQA